MIVIKIGGSLFNSSYLQDWLRVLSDQKEHRIVIVPGGGPFADQVRNADAQWNLPQACCHDMALLGMEQLAFMLHGLQKTLPLVKTLRDIKNSATGSMIWQPFEEVTKTNQLSKTWQTTSDSIALWLATRLQAERLMLIKSVEVERLSVSEILNTDTVDENFKSLMSDYRGQIKFMHASNACSFLSAIKD